MLDITNLILNNKIFDIQLSSNIELIYSNFLLSEIEIREDNKGSIFRVFSKNNKNINFFVKNDIIKEIIIYLWSGEKYIINSTIISEDTDVYSLLDIFNKLNIEWNIDCNSSTNKVLVLKLVTGIIFYYDLDIQKLLKISYS
jgi:hypothetical protein